MTDDWEAIEPENYRGDKNVVWSHQELVMRAMKSVLKIGCRELTSNIGVKQLKQGNEDIIIKEDTRKSFINSVRLCKSIMNRDFDNKAKENIGEILKQIEEEQERLLKSQWEWWNTLTSKQKIEKKLQIEKNFFNKTLIFYTDFIEYQIEAYWAIFEELNDLTGRLGDYEVEEIEG